MKTHNIKTPLAELLVVEIPENIERDYYLIYGRNPEKTYLSFRKTAAFKPPKKGEKLADGIWKPLGKPDEIREEDAAEVVKSFQFGTDEHPHFRFLNYKTDYFHCFTAKESLLSLLESEIYWNVNPEPHPSDIEPTNRNHYDALSEQWCKAESRTFDRNKTLIFKKNQSPTNKI